MCFWKSETMNISREEAVSKTMFEVCTEGDFKAVLSALKSFKSIQLPTDLIGSSPLHYAAKKNKLDIAQLLLNSRLCTLVNKMKKTPLHLAAQEGHVEMCKLLLSHGINVNLQDMMGLTALHWAVTHEHMTVVSVLMDHGADPNLMDKFGRSPLSIADANIATISIMTQLSQQKESEIKQSGPKRRRESSEYKDSNTKRRRISQDNISGLNFLKQHGISYLPKDDSTTIATALKNGQTAVLTEAGKQLLKLFKSYDAPDRDLQRLSKEMISQVQAKLNKSKPKSDLSEPNHSDAAHCKTSSTKSTLEKSSQISSTCNLEESIDLNLSVDSNPECNRDFNKKSCFNSHQYKNSVPPYNMEHPVSSKNMSSHKSPPNIQRINSSFTNPKWEKDISTLGANLTPLGICEESVHSSCIIPPRNSTGFSFNSQSQVTSSVFTNSQEHVPADSNIDINKNSSRSTISLSQKLIENPQSYPFAPELVPKISPSNYEAEFLKFCTDKSKPVLSNPSKTKTNLSKPMYSYPVKTSIDSVLHTTNSCHRTFVERTNLSSNEDQARLYAMCLDTMTRKLFVIPIKSNAEKAARRVQKDSPTSSTINDNSISIERNSSKNWKRCTGESNFIPSNKAVMQDSQMKSEVQEPLSENNLTNLEIAQTSGSDSVKKPSGYRETKPPTKSLKKYPLPKRRVKKRLSKVYKNARSTINKSSVLTEQNINNSDSLEDYSFKFSEDLSSPNSQVIPPNSQLNINLINTNGELSPIKISNPTVEINVGGKSLLVASSLNKLSVKNTSNLSGDNNLNTDNYPKSNISSNTRNVTFFSQAKATSFGNTSLKNPTKSNILKDDVIFSKPKSTNSFVDKNILNATKDLNSNVIHLKNLLKNKNITNENINNFTTTTKILNIPSTNTTASEPSNSILYNKALNQINDPNSLNSIGTINYLKSPRVINNKNDISECPSNPILNDNTLNSVQDPMNYKDPVKIIKILNIPETTSSSNSTLPKPVRPIIHRIIPRPRVACKTPSTTIMQPRLTPPPLVRLRLFRPCSKVAIPLNRNNTKVLSTNVYSTANGNTKIYSQKLPHLQNSHVVLAQNPMRLNTPSQTNVNRSINFSQVPNTSMGEAQQPTVQGSSINPVMSSESALATSSGSSFSSTSVKKIQQLPISSIKTISSNALGISSTSTPITLLTNKQYPYVSTSLSSLTTSSNSFARVSCNPLVSTTSSTIPTKVAFGVKTMGHKNPNNISQLKTIRSLSTISPTTSQIIPITSSVSSVWSQDTLSSKISVFPNNSTPLSSPPLTDTIDSSSLSLRNPSIVSCSSSTPVFNPIPSNATSLVQDTLPNLSKFNTDPSNSTPLVRCTSSNILTSNPRLQSVTSLAPFNLSSSNTPFSTSLVPFKREETSKPEYTLVRDCSMKGIPNFVVVPVPKNPKPSFAKTNSPHTVKKSAESEENSNNTSQAFKNSTPLHHNPSNKSIPNHPAIDNPTTKDLITNDDYLEITVIDMDGLDNKPDSEPIVPNKTTPNEPEPEARQIKDLVSFIKILEKDLKAQKDIHTQNKSPVGNHLEGNKKDSLNNSKCIESKIKQTMDERAEGINKTDIKNCSVYSERNNTIPKPNNVNYVSSNVTTVNRRYGNTTNDAIFTNSKINTDFNRSETKPVNTANFHVIPTISNVNSVIDNTNKVNNVSNNKINFNNMIGNPCNVNNTTYNITRNNRSDQSNSKFIDNVKDHSILTNNHIKKMNDNLNTNNNDIINNFNINDNLSSSGSNRTNINGKVESNMHKLNINKNHSCLSSERTLSPIKKYPLLKHTNSRSPILPRPRTADRVVFPLSSDSESEETTSQDLIGMLNSLLQDVRQMDDTGQTSVVLNEIPEPPLDLDEKECDGQNENKDKKYNSNYENRKTSDSYENIREIEYGRNSQNRNSPHRYQYMKNSQNNQSTWNSQTLSEESSQHERQIMTYSPSDDRRKTRSSSRDSQSNSRYDSPERLFAKFRKLTHKSRIVLDAKTKFKINNFISSLKYLNDENPATMSEDRRNFRKRFALNLVESKTGQNDPSMFTDKYTQRGINISPENSDINFLPHTTQSGFKNTNRFVASKCGSVFDSTGKRVPKIVELPDLSTRNGSSVGNMERSSQPNSSSYTISNNSFQVSSPSHSSLIDNFDPSLLLESLGPGPSLETCNLQKNDSNISLSNSSSGSLSTSSAPSSGMYIEPSVSVSQYFNSTLYSSPSSRYSTSYNGTSKLSNANIQSSIPSPSLYSHSSYTQNVSSQPTDMLGNTIHSSSVIASPTAPTLPSINSSADFLVSSTYDSNIPPNS